MYKVGIELTINYGQYGEKRKTVALNISEALSRELMEGMELSNDPFSLLLASPGAFGGRGDAITIRNKKFEMRHKHAIEIAEAMVPALMKAFGANDKIDGYDIE